MKTVLVFLCEGFSDWRIAGALTEVRMSQSYHVRTISFEKELIRSTGGLSVLPDLDFFPETDLADMDSSSVAMTIVATGPVLSLQQRIQLESLIVHCCESGIQVAVVDDESDSSGKTLFAKSESRIKRAPDPVGFARFVAEELGLQSPLSPGPAGAFRNKVVLC